MILTKKISEPVMKKIRIGFIGTGNMAQAIMKGILGSAMKNRVSISGFDTYTETAQKAKKAYKIRIMPDNASLIKNSDVVVMAVKPQNMEEVLSVSGGFFTGEQVIISIMAGVSIKKIQGFVPCVSVVRVMPNMPALVGEGACGFSASKQVKPSTLKLAKEILGTFCKVTYMLPESQIDSVTALSGSGPAYFFYYAEAMMRAAGEMGFDKEKAKMLIAQTMIGSGRLIMESEDSPEQLRIKVTSRGGTTQKALETMDASDMKLTIVNAVKAAKVRAQELGK
jgi:pyrroline-5-carboxylate reductase